MNILTDGEILAAMTPEAVEGDWYLPQTFARAIEAAVLAKLAALDSEREANALLTEQLAASQLREQQLREALEVVNNAGDDEWYPYTPEQAKKVISEALTLPQDASAIEAMIKKAGEVMRERFMCARGNGQLYPVEIRALPGVTLEDLRK